MKKWFGVILIVVVAAILISIVIIPAIAQGGEPDKGIPTSMSYQGYLADDNGDPVPGPIDITFTIYTAGGTPVWAEKHTGVNPSNGLFSVELGGNGSPMAVAMFDGDRYLGVKVGIDPEMNPRQKITSVGYALVAEYANIANSSYTLNAPDGNPENAVYVDNNGNVGIGTVNPNPYTKLHVDGSGILVTGSYPNIPTVAGAAIDYNAAFGARIMVSDGAGGWNKDLVLQPYGGNIGIGTVSPGAKLNVLNGLTQLRFSSGYGVATTHNALYLGLQNDANCNGTTKGFLWYIDKNSTNCNDDAKLILKEFQGFKNSGDTTSEFIDSNWKESLTITDGRIGIGTTNPQSTLQVNGYIQLDTITSAPPAADCDEESECGRMKFNGTSDVLYICSGASGWVTK